jgi:anti-sigma B factor antagonist
MSEHVIIESYDKIVLAKITKERLLEPVVIGPLGAALLKEVDRHARIALVLDLSEVEYMASAFIGQLVALHKAVGVAKGRLALCGLKPSILPLIKVMNLDKIFVIYPEAQAAINLFKRQAP